MAVEIDNLQVAKSHNEKLPFLKESVDSSYTSFCKNYESFHKDRTFVFDTSISEADKNVLAATKKPQLEANFIESLISRLIGEFAKQEPSVSVSSGDDEPIDPQTIAVVEGHMRHILFEANNDGFETEIYKEGMSGGFSVMKGWTEYANPKSKNQIIKVGRTFDPTLVGFDPLARAPHKGDGRYCFELFPKRREEFIEENPKIDINSIKFTRNVQGFSWSYNDKKNDILLICDFYLKKKRNKKILFLSDDRAMMPDEYEDYLKQHRETVSRGLTVQQEAQVIDERTTEITTICRYRFIENQVLEYIETDYSTLPLIFVDGNSIMLKEGGSGSAANHQKTRSYAYHAKDIQRLRNFAVQCLGNELEKMIQHTWIVAKETIDQEYADALMDNQTPSNIVYNAFMDNDPTKPLPPPQPVVRPPIPPEISNTISMTDSMLQVCLGTYDSSLGINDNQLSGKAIIAAATQSNAAAMPYIVGFLNALNQLAQFILELIPKYYKTPRTIPIRTRDGKRDFARINMPGTPQMTYDSDKLNVRVEAGVNFSVQKSQALQQMIALMQASPIYMQFMSQYGLETLLDNMEFRGSDTLKAKVPQFEQMLAQQQKMQMQAQQAQSQGQQNNPMMQLKAQELQMKDKHFNQELAMKDRHFGEELQMDAARVSLDQDKVENDKLDMTLKAEGVHNRNVVQAEKVDAEKNRTSADILSTVHDRALKEVDQSHRHAKEATELVHNIVNDNQQQEKNHGREMDKKSN